MPASSAPMADSASPFGMMFSPVLEIAIGVITLWAGGLGNIPPGWHLCDGTVGTPDLRNNFLPAAGPTFAVGSESGGTAHQHDLTTDGHPHGMQNPPGHFDFGPGYSITTQTRTDTATTSTNDNLPKYYALAYIQYLGP